MSSAVRGNEPTVWTHGSIMKNLQTTEIRCQRCMQVRMTMVELAALPCVPAGEPDVPEPADGGWGHLPPRAWIGEDPRRPLG